MKSHCLFNRHFLINIYIFCKLLQTFTNVSICWIFLFVCFTKNLDNTIKRLLNKKLPKKRDTFQYVLQGHHKSLDLLEGLEISLLCTCISTRSEWLGLHLSFLYEQSTWKKEAKITSGGAAPSWRAMKIPSVPRVLTTTLQTSALLSTSSNSSTVFMGVYNTYINAYL